jgi:hypothetical protein
MMNPPMRKSGSLSLLAAITVLFSACFDSPEYDHSPHIKFEGLYFGKAPNGEDSLVVSLSFKDGDGDLGFNPTDFQSPFNQINFVANNNGQLLPVAADLATDFNGYAYKSNSKTPRNPSYFILPLDQQVNELITLESKDDGFTLPPFTGPYQCFLNHESYLHEQLNPDTIFIWRENDFLIKDKSSIVDTLVSRNDPTVYYYTVVNYFYIMENPHHYNLKVEFFVKSNDGTFKEYDFRKEFCETFDGRFPILTDDDRAVEGVINYSMVSAGFLPTFSVKTLKLAITVYDKALNASNRIETPEFTLQGI